MVSAREAHSIRISASPRASKYCEDHRRRRIAHRSMGEYPREAERAEGDTSPPISVGGEQSWRGGWVIGVFG